MKQKLKLFTFYVDSKTGKISYITEFSGNEYGIDESDGEYYDSIDMITFSKHCPYPEQIEITPGNIKDYPEVWKFIMENIKCRLS